ncbi:THAP domain-containing protein 6-like isoform X2 [Photinus pyralis]|uniref:THAP domain-containing protein 6-like isoform X2 n=1 Tax=Photinus pyralis TaxID=7054 RepID=UPI001267550C|nr:THAP domain-containing protein 6-like isoform X2 [Photinus pyralis]
MVATCIVCKNYRGKKTANQSGQGISFHTFPKDNVAKQKWMEALGLTNIADSSRICSTHFSDTDFEEQLLLGSRRKLKKAAVPSLNENPQYSNKIKNENVEGEEAQVFIDVGKALWERSSDTVNDEAIPCPKYRRIGDIDVKKVCTSPAEAKLCLEVAIETIQEQRRKIRKLQTSNNKLRKSFIDLKALLNELKEKNVLSSEAWDILIVS